MKEGGDLQLLLPVGLTLPGGPGGVRGGEEGGRGSSSPTTSERGVNFH